MLKSQDLNNKPVEVWTGSEFSILKSKDLKVSHLIKCSSGIVPADLLILSTSDEKVKSKSYYENEEEKQAPLVIKSLVSYSDHQFFGLSRLVGIAEVEESSSRFSELSGKIKIRGKPNSVKVNKSNFLFQGSSLEGTVLGLVVYTGQDTKLSKSLNIGYRGSFINSKLNKRSWILFIVLALLLVFSALPGYLQLNDFILSDSLIYFFLLYNNILPISLFVLLELLRVFNWFFVCKTLKFAQVSGFTQLENLSKVEFLAIDEPLLTEEHVLSRYVNGDEVLELVKEDSDQGTLVTDRSFRLTFSKIEVNHHLWTLAILSTTATCQDGLIVGSKSEVCIIKAAEQLGFNVVHKDSNSCTISYLGKVTEFQVVGVSKVEHRSRSVVSSADNGYFLVLGQGPSVNPLISDTDMFKAEDFTNEFFSKGLLPFTLAYKRLSNEKILKVSDKLESISTSRVSQEKKFKRIFNKLEKELRFLTIFAVDPQVNQEKIRNIQEFLELDLKVFVVSADDRFKAEGIVNALGFSNIFSLTNLDSEANCYRALQKAILKKLYKSEEKRDEFRAETFKDFDDSPQLKPSRYTNSEKVIANHRLFRKFTIKNNLEFLEKDFTWQKQATLLIDRSSLLLCIKNQVTLKMLVALLSASKACYFYNMHPDDKVTLVNLLQNNIKHRPGVLAVCNDFWSLGMAQAACSSASVSESFFCDFRNISLSELPKVIQEFKVSGQVSWFCVGWSFYKNILEVSIQFLYQFFQQFSAADVWSNEIAIFYNLITGIQLLTRKAGRTSILKHALVILFQVAIVLLFLILSSTRALFEEGSSENFDVFSRLLYTCIVASVVFMCFCENKYWSGLALAFAVLVIVTSLIFELRPFDSGIFWVQVVFGTLVLIVPGLAFSRITAKEQKYPNLASVYRESDHFTGDKDLFIRKRYTLKFKNKRTERDFRLFYAKEVRTTVRVTLCLLFIIFLIWTVSMSILENSQSAVVIRGILTICYFLFFLFSFSSYFETNSSFSLSVIMSFSMFIKFYLEFSSTTLSIISTLLIPSCFFILLSTDWLMVCYINLATYLLNIITVSLFFTSEWPLEKLYLITLITTLFSVSAIVGYEIEMHHREVYVLTQQIKMQVENTQSVLEILLPEFVVARVKAGVRYIAEDRGKVTVIFCDICEFEELCSDYSPKEFCSLLDSIFTLFDQLCDDFGVTKIETVGKTYMACCGLNKNSEADVPPARLACDLALGILRECEKISLKKGFLKVKIGIHTGPVTAGVVGFHKPQFSLVGDTVNTASRMCSTLDRKNAVQISMETYEALKQYSGLSFESCTVSAKGKGEMDTFIVTRNKELRVLPLRMRTSSTSPVKTVDWRESVMAREDTELIPNIWNFKTKTTKRQQDYIMKKIKGKSSGVHIFLFIIFLTYLILVICDITKSISSTFLILEVATKAIVCILGFIFFIIYKKCYQDLNFYYFTFILYLLAFISSILSIFSKDQNVFIVEFCSVLLLLNHSQNIQMLFSVFLNLALVALYLLSTYLIKGSISTQEILLLIFSAGVNLFSINKIESQFRKSFNLKIKSDKEIRVTEHLLVQMMPAHVVYRLSEGSSITDQLYDVTILYADIVGFTAWSSGKSPSEVVQMLSNLFTEFDKKCVELGVYKVHTIGDCYVVLGYLTGKRDPVGECWNVFELANYMIQIIEEENQAYGMQLAMRIGIHTGHLVAGVIGNNVVRYDIWGTDVLVANKMESNGKPGVVNVSEVTMKMLQEKDNGELQFDFNKEVHGFSSYFVKRSKIIEDHV
jgi:class 3 adenylate cyclase